jgi:hypothetical protein
MYSCFFESFSLDLDIVTKGNFISTMNRLGLSKRSQVLAPRGLCGQDLLERENKCVDLQRISASTIAL